MRKIWNFSAGPAQIPVTVLKKAQEELLSYNSSGMSVMELSHRSPEFQEIIEEAEASFRRLLNVFDGIAVLSFRVGESTVFIEKMRWMCYH